MIKNWMITGDTHGQMDRFNKLTGQQDLGVIILGDAGCNYYKNKKDDKIKQQLEDTGCYYYLVRGNHEDRPENVDGMISVYDPDVQGDVYMQETFPHIKYLKDGGIYMFGTHRTLILGGAYSVDKEYRILMNWMWFPQEQLSKAERDAITANVEGQKFDFVFSHTCPISWEPFDLFLNSIDQSKVDKSMELWLDDLKNKIEFDVWCFGHYHADRLERPGVEIFFTEMENLETTWDRWHSDEELGWWYEKSPYFNEPR